MKRSYSETPVGGPSGQLVAGGELQLAQHRGYVGLDRLDRDVEPLGELPVGVAAGDQPQHLALPWRELVESGVGRGYGRRGRRLRGEGVEHEAGEPGREHRITVADPSDGFDQFVGTDGLGDVAARAGPDQADHVLGGVGHRQGEEPDGRALGEHALEDGLATAAREVHVEQHDLGLGLEDAGDGRRHVDGGADDVDALLDLGPHAGEEQPMVVDQERAHASRTLRRHRHAVMSVSRSCGDLQCDLGADPGRRRTRWRDPRRVPCAP